jgi:hypothetical protein
MGTRGAVMGTGIGLIVMIIELLRAIEGLFTLALSCRSRPVRCVVVEDECQ